MVDGLFTTEVDEASLQPETPANTEFLPGVEKLFFLGELTGLPAESEIEVRWTRSTEGEPFYATRATGSGSYKVLSRF